MLLPVLTELWRGSLSVPVVTNVAVSAELRGREFLHTCQTKQRLQLLADARRRSSLGGKRSDPV